MHNFEYQHGELYCEQVPVSRIAKEVGTPCYIYSYATLVRHFRAYDGAFKSLPHVIAFAMKANSNIAILRLMAKDFLDFGHAIQCGLNAFFAFPCCTSAGLWPRIQDRAHL